jgi:paired amphipathic helix protein Sin3a
MFADSKNQDLFEILKRERAMILPTTQDQINNRRNTEKILGPDENLFRMDWVSWFKALIPSLNTIYATSFLTLKP